MLSNQKIQLYAILKIAYILSCGFISLLKKVDLSYQIMGVTGVLLMVTCAGEMIIDSNDVRKDKKELVWNISFTVIELILGILIFWVLPYWYYAIMIYVIVKPWHRIVGLLCIPLPSIFYLISNLLHKNTHSILESAAYLCGIFLLSLCLYGFHRLLSLYECKEDQIKESVKQSVLNELKAKKMSRELAQKVYLAQENARYEERENIARSMHNAVGHTITSAIVALSASKVMYEVNPNQAKDKLSVAEERMRMSLEEIRQAVRVLDKEAVELSVEELIHLLRIRCEQFMLDTEIMVVFDSKDTISAAMIHNRHCEFLHSALSEALSNGVRHGQAGRFYVKISCDSKHIQLLVKDNGTSIDQIRVDDIISHGYGLKKIHKYVMDCGGSLHITATEGFQIIIELPMV